MKNLNVAIPTPFHEDESLNLDEFKPIVEYLKNNGIESLLVSGSTGEQHSMSMEERLQIINYFNEQNFQDIELMFGVAATRTKDAIRLVQALEESFFDVILIGFPPYIRPTQEQAVFYVDELMKHTTKEVALYNNPPRTGFDLSANSLNELISRHTNLLGLKESGDINRHRNTNLPQNFIMFAAGDIDFTTKINNGCNGLSSIVGNVYPQEIKQAVDDLILQKPVDHQAINQFIAEVNRKQAVVAVKNHYNHLGINAGICRSPLVN